MSESKAEYYAKHLEQQNPNEQMELFQPVSLPTLLAGMVTEYAGSLVGDPSDPLHREMVEQFNRILLSAAQPLLTEYLTAITTPPKFVAKEQQEDEAGLPMMVRAVLAAERQRAEEALALVRAGKGVPAARKHLGLE